MKKNLFTLVIMAACIGSTLVAMHQEMPMEKAPGRLSKRQRLWLAVKEGDAAQVQDLLRKGVGPNVWSFVNDDLMSALMVAVRNSTEQNPKREAYFAIVSALLEAGARPKTTREVNQPREPERIVDEAAHADTRTKNLLAQYREPHETGHYSA